MRHMPLEDKTCELIKQRPEYIEILENACKIEENPPNDFTRQYGWEWHQAKAHPGKLTKLVSEGLIEIRYKSRRYTHYKLADREAVRKALKKCVI